MRRVFLSALFLLLIVFVSACQPGAGLSPVSVFVTATPEESEFWQVTAMPDDALRVGASGGAYPVAAGTESPLDLTSLTAIPTIAETFSTDQVPVTVLPPTPIPAPTQVTLSPEALGDSAVYYSAHLGINFINSVQHPADAERFAVAVDTGSGWDRFPMYWNDIEREKGIFTWDYYDRVVVNDVRSGFAMDVILLGVPEDYRTETSSPRNLYEPIFNDGSDTPGVGKSINPRNRWARFVFTAVQRYKPGGELSRVEGWAPDLGVTVWEIWNERDFSTFWNGSVEDYARLLEVAYTVIHYADPEGRVMVGGLVIWEKPGWLASLLDLYKHDPETPEWYPFDIVAIHSYSQPANIMELLQKTESLLAIYSLRHIPVWVNESGVPVWDDYPGPTWATRPDQIVWRATQSEQANYIIQNAAFAFLNEVEVLFHFQLFDDCGNQPRGTTFAPHDGSTCDVTANCWGDALGLVRNTTGNVCFNQHPLAGTPRDAYEAWRVVADVFGGVSMVPLTAERIGLAGEQLVLVFARPGTGEIVRVLWNEGAASADVTVPAYGESARVITKLGDEFDISPDPGDTYTFTLNPATNKNQAANPGSFMIGGDPVILIETSERPFVSIAPILDTSRQAVLVKWRSNRLDIQVYQVYYRDDSSGLGEWVKWFETGEPGETVFVGGPGRTYSFFARGLLPDGTWTSPDPFAQAQTTLAQ